MTSQSPVETTISKIKTIYVPADLKKSVKDRMAQCWGLLQAKGLKAKMPSVSFDLRGKTAGKAYLQKNHIQLNAVLLVENRQNFVDDTVGHELAHLATYALHGKHAQAHGPEWKAIMLLFGQSPTRCHSYKTDNSSVLKTFTYQCACKEHQLSSRQHNSGRVYSCKLCKRPLVLANKKQYAKVAVPNGTEALPVGALVHVDGSGPLDKQPSEAMVNFAKAISGLTGVLLTEDILRSFTKTKIYIDLNKNKRPEPPTEKQINFALHLAAKLGQEVPSYSLKSKIALSSWISLHQQKKPE